MTSCRSKNHYAHVSDAMRAADRYERRDGYVFEWYRCSECEQYHLRSRKHDGIKVLSMQAIRQTEGGEK